MGKKMKIYLCDMVHNYLGAGSYMFPLNIAYLAAYAKKYFPNETEIKLFKYPQDFIDQFKKVVPDIVGFSNYTWNADLNGKLADFIKAIYKRTLVIFGGPNINYTTKGVERFFITHKTVDFYLPFQGEKPFIDLLGLYINAGRDIKELKNGPIDGMFFYDEAQNIVAIGKRLERISKLDDIPSPYLTGILDEFFDTKLIPLVETNRGCPYQCTFCAQGLSSYRQMHYFSLERVKAELKYIAEHVKHTNLLNLADSNFGIAERDLEIAKYITNLSEKTGYPQKCSSNLAKNQPKIFEIAKILKNINLAVSLQSLDDIVLQNVKRKNISISIFKDIVKKVNDLGAISGTEIILGMPGETRNSHIETLKKLFDWDVSYIVCYNGLVLDGTELSSFKENGKFKCKTKFRLIDSSFGKYNDILSFEAEEGILSTDTMTQDELLSFRPVHWLIQFLWNYRFYYDLLKYVKSLGVNPLNYILKLTDDKNNNIPQKANIVFREFIKEAKGEWFDSIENLQNHYSQSENFKLLKEGLLCGKMNGKYIFKILIECKREFEEHLFNTFLSYSSPFHLKGETCREIINFLSASIIDFNGTWDKINKEKYLICKYNIIEWRESKYNKRLEDLYSPEGFKFRFFLPKEQERSLKKILMQYDHKNKNVTLRKMSEWMDIKQFFYKVELDNKLMRKRITY
ncbi:MAG: cobalamin B12-binding domain-containing protein [Candidatus Saganbacteria bacterium]|uniref:Cobalamin B12-binding domain-containing protein n=1 Tax=Candidatus Saganbacteria bacterium TaxID=2575572 RepID=A0A833L2K5_UNCSA|nr:MAG: cobalamin B12-binding domain-containing protein [Candidatus Saganbacteria bacterium]